ncbi:MAG: UDP-2,3-diacylglucosamine diphosphatase LpxI [Holosporales bacterium]|jgi:DUF1009 family protein|nr:UDP-2,3-diacylglucosamine diphosphatase LpxI [Holosporales bacterium]
MRLGLLCGHGTLPILLAQAQSPQLAALVFFEKRPAAPFPTVPQLCTTLGEIGTILQFLRTHNVDTLLLAGNLRRPALAELKFDAIGLKWSTRLGKRFFQGDDALLHGIITLLEEEGFTILGLSDVMSSLLTPAGVLTNSRPTPAEEKDIETGWRVLHTLGAMDIGQAVVVQQGLILGVEAIEGTQALIHRCAPLQRAGSAAILVKGAKPRQDIRVDVPTVGEETIEALWTSGFRGMALEAGRTCLLQKESVLQQANLSSLFIIGVHRAAS